MSLVETFFVAQMLQRLERQVAAIRPQAVAVATALSKDEYPVARHATAGLHEALDAFVATTERLQDHVVAHDGMGALGSVGELTLRARVLVVKAQVEVLRQALREPATAARSVAWFGGQIQGADELRAFVEGRLTKIHAIWLPYRIDQPSLPGMIEHERSTLYRIMVRIAQRALCELRDEPDLSRFLACGMNAKDLPRVQVACEQILAILALEIDAETARALPPRRGRLGTPPGVPEQR